MVLGCGCCAQRCAVENHATSCSRAPWRPLEPSAPSATPGAQAVLDGVFPEVDRLEVVIWAVFCDEEVTPGDLAPEIRDGAAGRAPRRAPLRRSHVTTLASAVRDAEHAAITAALAAYGGNLSQTARALGIERNTLKRKLIKLGLSSARNT
jgi:transcriptional regulator with GAF, ATPase, and Fis domain